MRNAGERSADRVPGRRRNPAGGGTAGPGPGSEGQPAPSGSALFVPGYSGGPSAEPARLGPGSSGWHGQQLGALASKGPVRGFPPAPGQPPPVYPPGQFSAWNRPGRQAGDSYRGKRRAAGSGDFDSRYTASGGWHAGPDQGEHGYGRPDGADYAEPGYSVLAVSDPAADVTSTQTWAAVDAGQPWEPSPAWSGTDPGQPVPGQAVPGQAVPGQADPDWAEAGWASGPAAPGLDEPRNGDPGYGGPGYAEPGYAEPGYGEPGPGPAGYGEPAFGDPGVSGPGVGGPAYGAPGFGGPDQGGPAYGEPGPGGPGYREPGPGAPGYGEPAYGAPGFGEPGFGEPGFGPGDAERDFGETGFGTPDFGAPGDFGGPGFGQRGVDEPGGALPRRVPHESGAGPAGQLPAGGTIPGRTIPGRPAPGEAGPAGGRGRRGRSGRRADELDDSTRALGPGGGAIPRQGDPVDAGSGSQPGQGGRGRTGKRGQDRPASRDQAGRDQADRVRPGRRGQAAPPARPGRRGQQDPARPGGKRGPAEAGRPGPGGRTGAGTAPTPAGRAGGRAEPPHDSAATAGRPSARRAQAARARRRKRSIRLVLGSAVIIAVLAATAFVVTGGLSGSHQAADTSPQASPSSSPTAPPSPTPALGRWGHIATRSDDSVPLTLAELFPAKFTASSSSYTRTVRRSGSKCVRSVIGSKLQSAIGKAKCTQVMRASYLSANRKLMGTIGVLNLVSVTATERAGKAAGGGDFIAQLAAAKGPTHRLTKGTGLEETEIKGHYLVLVWAEYASLKAPKTKGQRLALETFCNRVIQNTANLSLASREITGKPRTP
jgi:hypothetical protein